jgi:hypothetical protein
MNHGHRRSSLPAHCGFKYSERYNSCRYAPFVYENKQSVVHSEELVTDDSVYIDQVECLWSLLNPWLAKFRGLSKPGLEQSVRTYGFVRTLNLAGAPLHGLLDCFVVNVFR